MVLTTKYRVFFSYNPQINATFRLIGCGVYRDYPITIGITGLSDTNGIKEP